MLSSLRRVALCVQVVRQPIEAALPTGPTFDDPILGRPKRLWLNMAGAHSAGLLGPDQAARFQYLKVLDYRRERHGERCGEVADRSRPAAQQSDHRSAARIGERLEHTVQWLRIAKH